MFVHLGGDMVITTDVVEAIYDLDTSTVNKSTRDYLAKAEAENRVVYATFDLPKSFIVCTDGRIIVCSYNTETLKRRCNRKTPSRRS